MIFVSNPVIFSTEKYAYLRDELSSFAIFQKGELETKYFPDGERYLKIHTKITNKHVIIIGGTISDADTLELFDIACGAARYGALSLTIVIPYFGYSTMERAVQYGEIVTAKSRALLLSAIPKTPMGNKIILVDLHTEGLPHYFEAGVRPIHVYSKKIIIDACNELYGKNFVLASTDAGRAKWVESLANDMGVDAAFIFKRRVSGDETHVTGINADVKDKNVIIYDDMIRTGGSLVKAAQAYKKAGANEISVITTHGIFCGDGLNKLKNSGIINKVICTNTHPNALALQSDFLEIKSISELLKDKLID